MYQVDSEYVDLYFYYPRLLYSFNSFLPCLFYLLILHSSFKKIINQVGSGNGFNLTQLHPVASSVKQTNAVSVTVWGKVEPRPRLRGHWRLCRAVCLFKKNCNLVHFLSDQ